MGKQAQAGIFVTGGSGFIGGALIERLRSEFRVRAMARSEPAVQAVVARGAEPVRCSLADLTPTHIKEAAVVIHCAALVAEWAPPGHFADANIAGTVRALEAAQGAGVRKFIHMSTDSVLVTGRPLRGVDETMPLPTRSPFEYAQTKAEAERKVLAANNPGQFETIVIRPTFVWGPGDTTILPEIKSMVDRGRFVWIGGGKNIISTTHIENLVHGIRSAIAFPRGRESFFITDDVPQNLRRFLTRYSAAAGIELPDKSVPSLPVKAAAFLIEAVSRAISPSRKPPLTRFAVFSLATDYWVQSDKAREMLGYVPIVSIDEGLASLSKASRTP